MTTAFHPLVKRFLDGELGLADLPVELHAEARMAQRLLGAVDRAPVTLSRLESRVMDEVRRRVRAVPLRRRWWQRLGDPWDIRVRLRPWILGPALAAAAALVLLIPRSQPTTVPVAAAAPESVFVRFVLYAPGAHRVSVAGSFNQWDPTAAPLALSGAAGVWTAMVPVPVGQHQYAFLVDGRRWVSDPAAPAVDDGFGRRNSVVSVAATGARIL